MSAGAIFQGGLHRWFAPNPRMARQYFFGLARPGPVAAIGWGTPLEKWERRRLRRIGMPVVVRPETLCNSGGRWATQFCEFFQPFFAWAFLNARAFF